MTWRTVGCALLIATSPFAGCFQSEPGVSLGNDGADAGGEGEGEGEPVQHPSCSEPLPDPLPGVPPVNVGPEGRPRFTDWESMACDDASDWLCPDPDPETECGMCMGAGGESPGVCNYADADIWCDGEGEAVGWDDGRCWLCGPPEAHAAACCESLPGFDCRRWPYASDGVPGSVCARHEDCEPGLVCGDGSGEGYGICQCPGLEPGEVRPAEDCFQ